MGAEVPLWLMYMILGMVLTPISGNRQCFDGGWRSGCVFSLAQTKKEKRGLY